MPYRYIIKQRILLKWIPLLAILVLFVAPGLLALEKRGNNANINAGVPVPQEVSLSSETNLSDIGLSSPLALSFESMETNNSASARLSRKQYHYEQNGVSITVTLDVYKLGPAPTIKEITESVSKRLIYASGLELVDLKYHHAEPLNRKVNRDAGLQSIFHSAIYLMQPFAKEVHYEVRNYINDNRHWMITASYKSCDAAGQTLTNKFLNTLRFI